MHLGLEHKFGLMISSGDSICIGSDAMFTTVLLVFIKVYDKMIGLVGLVLFGYRLKLHSVCPKKFSELQIENTLPCVTVIISVPTLRTSGTLH